MTILGIETSCDETGVGLIEQRKDGILQMLGSNLASSLEMHAKTGGIIPEIAAREQVKYIIPLIKKVLAETDWKNINAIAVTVGPGLIGSLLVGVETAKTLAYLYNKPLIPINHMHGHIYANFISKTQNLKLKTQNERDTKGYELNLKIIFPAIALVVSGGHTDLLLMKDERNIEVLGGTRDDAAGEAFDKIGRLLGLPYPAGAAIALLAEKGDPKAFRLPRPMIGSGDFDFSFSGLKTAVLREVTAMKQLNNETINNLCASVQEAIVSVLVRKTLKAAIQYNAQSILLGGGVTANQKLRDSLALEMRDSKLEIKLHVPPTELCTDNGAMIAAAGFFQYHPQPWQNITAKPEMYYEAPLASIC